MRLWTGPWSIAALATSASPPDALVLVPAMRCQQPADRCSQGARPRSHHRRSRRPRGLTTTSYAMEHPRGRLRACLRQRFQRLARGGVPQRHPGSKPASIEQASSKHRAGAGQSVFRIRTLQGREWILRRPDKPLKLHIQTGSKSPFGKSWGRQDSQPMSDV